MLKDHYEHNIDYFLLMTLSLSFLIYVYLRISMQWIVSVELIRYISIYWPGMCRSILFRSFDMMTDVKVLEYRSDWILFLFFFFFFFRVQFSIDPPFTFVWHGQSLSLSLTYLKYLLTVNTTNYTYTRISMNYNDTLTRDFF